MIYVAQGGILPETIEELFVTELDHSRLIWIDLEMTGLDTLKDHIIEIATVVTDKVIMAMAEKQTLEFLSKWVEKGQSPMCGNSICQDRRFLARQMPALERFFHYRNLDVSTVKELVRRWAPRVMQGFQKNTSHLALDDVHDSINELIHYRQHFMRVDQ